MTLPGAFLAAFYLAIAAASVLVNRDAFSPAKLLLGFLAVYFADAAFSGYGAEIYITVFLLLCVGLAAVALESRAVRGLPRPAGRPRFDPPAAPRGAIAILWLASLVPIAAQLYAIALFGGIEAYVASIQLRVVEWRGLGHLRVLIGLFGTINVLYFAILLARPRAGRVAWALFSMHLLILVLFGLLSGSRGTLLFSFVFLAMVWNFLRRPISAVSALGLAGVLLFAAMVLGTARQGYRLGPEGIQTGLDRADAELNTSMFRYGLIPLELVYSRDPVELQYGLTFATAVTNFVPRSIWPEKPDPGGVVLTKQYTGNAWHGLSNLSTGLLAESMLNFGYAGIVVGFGLLMAAVMLNLRLYVWMLRRRERSSAAAAVLGSTLYAFFVIATTGLVAAEFTNAITGFATRAVPLVLLVAVIYRPAPWQRPAAASARAAAGPAGEPATA